MDHEDDKLQESIERNLNKDSGIESLAYRKVFDALNKEPDVKLSPLFSDKIINQILEAKSRHAYRLDLIWLSLGLAIFIATSIVIVIITGFKFDSGAFTFLSNYGSLLLFGFGFVLFLLWVEKQILPRNQRSH